jgi:primosomal protein N' (replication factor Y)
VIVSVAFPITIDGLYDYKVPTKFEGSIRRGMPVRVLLRNRPLWGVVIAIKEKSEFPNLKEVEEVKGEGWSRSSEALITLYQWISDYYQSPLGKVFRPIIKKSFADRKAKEMLYFTATGTIPETLSEKQMEFAQKLSATTKNHSTAQLKKEFGLTTYMINRLEKEGVIRRVKEEVVRESDSLYRGATISGTLSEKQQEIVDRVWDDRENPQKPYLLHGITGSGKTYVYIELARRTLAENRGVIILVPEISLTPQTISRFADALGENIAVMHSKMSEGERRDSMEMVVSGKRRVVIGVRSTIMLPMFNPGLIVVDEEHDGSYKQSDPEPRYQARDVAIMRGRLQNALVLMGSGTPAIESYSNALSGKYHHLTLTERFGAATLPVVNIVNMNKERNSGNWSPIADVLRRKIDETVVRGKQVILLLNRRGFSTSLVCRSCGHIRQCPHCSVNMVYHRNGDIVKCHQCGLTISPDFACSECGEQEMKYGGTGIQKVEDYLLETFPGFRVLRMDQDTTSRKGGHTDIIHRFADGEADILLGTQMVAKGLNFPRVSLVGVLQADTALSLPDFRASERLFQLLTQVAGRAGREDSEGEVFVQTYSPKEPAIAFTQNHDYISFYNHEIELRKEVGYPPFSRLARILVVGKSEGAVGVLCRKINDVLEKYSGDELQVLGPAPALMSRLKDEFRYSFMIKSGGYQLLNSAVTDLRNQINTNYSKECRYKIDIDPVGMG